MKKNNIFAILLILSLGITACSNNESSFNGESQASSIANTSSSASYSLPEREEGVSLETFTEEVNKLEPQTNSRKIRVSFHIVETLDGSVMNARDKNGDLLPQGETVTDLVLESINENASNVKIVSGQANTRFSRLFTTGFTIGLSNHLSYVNERRDAVNREAQPGWNVYRESLTLNPFNVWMVESGSRPANANVEGTFFAYTEDERAFDTNGYVRTMTIKEFTYIDGNYSKWDEGTNYYKGSFTAVAQGTYEYLD